MNTDLLAAIELFASWPAQERDDVGRFLSLVRFSDDCWMWAGDRTHNGYGRFWTRAGRTVAHRWIYERVVGPIPDEHQLDHLCRIKGCVRPAHLEPLTAADHNRRTREATVECPSGHPYDETNTRVYRGRRYCRACNNNGGSGRQTTGARTVLLDHYGDAP